jgi:hypothetical protein
MFPVNGRSPSRYRRGRGAEALRKARRRRHPALERPGARTERVAVQLGNLLCDLAAKVRWWSQSSRRRLLSDDLFKIALGAALAATNLTIIEGSHFSDSRYGKTEELNYTIAHLSRSEALLGLGGSNHGHGPGRRIERSTVLRTRIRGYFSRCPYVESLKATCALPEGAPKGHENLHPPLHP